MSNSSISKEYLEHKVFNELSEMSKFYDSLSYSIASFTTLGTDAIINIDTRVLSSISGSLESIKDVLVKARINDAYSLLRKYYDVTVINVYTNLYLKDNFSIDNFVVDKINNWIKGTEKLPRYEIMSKYIKKSEKLRLITELLQKGEIYKNIRFRCNDHTHYNYYRDLLFNDNQISPYPETRIKLLDIFLKDLISIFVQHLSLLFFLNEHYMASSDYVDALDCGMIPEEGSQYWVAPFIQEAFDRWIKANRSDIAGIIKANTSVRLS